jgi:hypothetical protein
MVNQLLLGQPIRGLDLGITPYHDQPLLCDHGLLGGQVIGKVR